MKDAGETLGQCMANEPLEAARASFRAARERYVAALEEKGIEFAPAGAGRAHRAELRQALRDAGAVFRNDGASIVSGWLSGACVECTGCGGSETFSTTLKCHRDCYFCFNRNLADYDTFFSQGCPWESELARSAADAGGKLACVALTGGEPLVDIDEAVRFLEAARRAFPGAHMRMYTSGDLLCEEAAKRLAEAGLSEVRFSVKLDDTPELQERVLENMARAGSFIDDVMVEMPVIPGTGEQMRALMTRFERVGIRGMNLLEFCFPFACWDEFSRRGFTVRNPPYPVMFDYAYSGGLAIAGSEELALELMLWGMGEGLSFGMHYCSLENKHRSEMRQRNEDADGLFPCMSFDAGDFFLKTGKLFGPDRMPGKEALGAAGCTDFVDDEEEDSTAFPPAFAPALAGVPVRPQLAFNVLDHDEEGGFLVEVGLFDADAEEPCGLY